MAKKEISWKGRTEDGEKREVYVRHEGNRWIFHEREKRFDSWQEVESPSLDDWMHLLDSVRRRVQRRLLKPEDEERVKSLIRKRFPDERI